MARTEVTVTDSVLMVQSPGDSSGLHASAPQAQGKVCSLVRALLYSFISLQMKSEAPELRQQTSQPDTATASELRKAKQAVKIKESTDHRPCWEEPNTFTIYPVSAHKTARSRQDSCIICPSLRNRREGRLVGSQQALEVWKLTIKSAILESKRKMHGEIHYIL